MGESSKKEPGKGCMAKVSLMLLVVLFAGVLAAGYFACQAQDLEEIAGYGGGKDGGARDLSRVMEKSLDRGHSLTFSEEELNRWLAQTLATRQGGFAARWVSLDGVWVRVLDGHAEIIQERRVLGRRFTVSVFLQLERTEQAGKVSKQAHLHGGPYHELLPRPLRGGRFGQLVVPQGFLVFVMPSYKKLAEQFRPEIRQVEEMSSIQFEKGSLILNPFPKAKP